MKKQAWVKWAVGLSSVAAFVGLVEVTKEADARKQEAQGVPAELAAPIQQEGRTQQAKSAAQQSQAIQMDADAEKNLMDEIRMEWKDYEARKSNEQREYQRFVKDEGYDEEHDHDEDDSDDEEWEHHKELEHGDREQAHIYQGVGVKSVSKGSMAGPGSEIRTAKSHAS
ncbi:hypothetical protein [Aneurinibacillus sp. UBA3580]|jgi:hypothetical protein|uniref:hypothetical protein n=1 Tax=Aneurinibacillus sp. UBA3580 TaxID=1946041 RepID=UPI00257DEC81|nr:hypothetical protein [Aneurinibacillus sp. UBA3580]